MPLTVHKIKSELKVNFDLSATVRAFIVLYLLVVAVNIYASLRGGITLDQARDAYFAARIAAGLEFPLGGPPIFSTFQVGPLWFYICSLPLLFGGGLASIAIFTAILSTLKYPLAFWLGQRLLDARFGWLLTVAVFCTGWTWIPLMFLTHAALVETTIWLLFAVMLSWWRTRSTPMFAGVGFASALCVHAHPSTLLIAASACVYVATQGIRIKRWRGVVALFAGGIFLFIPYLVEQTRLDWDVFSAINQYIGTGIQWPSLEFALRLIAAAFLNGHNYELQYEAGLSLQVVNIVMLAMAGLLVAIVLSVVIAAIGNLRRFDARQKKLASIAALCLVALLAQAIFLVTIRQITPFWMMFSMLPLSATLFACVLSLMRNVAWLRALKIFTVVLFATSAMVSAPGYLADSYNTMFLLDDGSPGLMDVKYRSLGGRSFPLASHRLSDVDRVAEVSARYGVAHGLAAIIIEESFGSVKANMRPRPSDALPALGGMSADAQLDTHIAAFTAAAWKSIGRAPTFIDGNLGWAKPTAIFNPIKGHLVAHPDSPKQMMARPLFNPPTKFALDFVAACGQIIAVTNILRPYAATPLISASVADKNVLPRYQDNATHFFDLPSCAADEKIKWQFRFVGVREALDVVSF
jgi:hypothetical protein